MGDTRRRTLSASVSAVLVGSLLATGSPIAFADARDVPVQARVKPVLAIGSARFRDLNANGTLDPYEDWRRPIDARIADLLARLSLEEKAGMLLIDTLNADPLGAVSTRGKALVLEEHMTRFIFRNPVVQQADVSAPFNPRSGAPVTPAQAAEFFNAIQALAESTRLGVPVLFKSNARNHFDTDARVGINEAAGAFSEWPKEAGLAATRDRALIREFGDTVRQEWTAIGLRSLYGYMADLATEPRWYRVHETFTEDADLAATLLSTLVGSIQGERLGASSVAMTLKHFPGGGPQEGGGDPHYYFGRNQSYPANRFNDHLKPFRAAIQANVAAIMPYYGVPLGQRVVPNNVGMSFSRGVVTDLLRSELGFRGYVNSDTGIIGPPGVGRAWGLEGRSVSDLLALSIDAGVDVLSGFSQHRDVLDLVAAGRVSEARLDESIRRLLHEQFALGLFENPYVDPALAARTVGNAAFRAKAALAQRKSIVLLQNDTNPQRRGDQPLLPLALASSSAPIAVYTMGFDAAVVRARGYHVTSGDHAPDQPRPSIPPHTRYALIRVTVTNPVLPIPNPSPFEPSVIPGQPPQTLFGGALPDELDYLAFSDMVGKRSWVMTPKLADIQAVMREVGPNNTILAIYFRQPYVLDEASGLRSAGAILATFGVSDEAVMDIVTGRFRPSGKLPFALANSADAIRRQAPDAPGYARADTLFPFGFGKSF